MNHPQRITMRRGGRRGVAAQATVLLGLALLALTLAGCFGGSDAAPEEEVIVRTPRPTFTPTPKQPTPTPTLLPPSATPAPAGTGGADPNAPIAVVNDDLINARREPDLNADIVQVVNRGTEFQVVGKSADGDWWQLCCIEDSKVWIFFSYVDTTGNVDALPVTEGQPEVAAAPTAAPTVAPPPTNTPVPAAAQPAAGAQPATQPEQAAAPAEAPTDTPAPTEPPAPAFPFNLVAQEQFPESNNLVRIFLYVYQGDRALEGYSLKVTKDGADLPVSAKSSDEAGQTWPVANPRQRWQNMKVEFPNVLAGGTWQVQLIDNGGNPAGPPASFTLTQDDTNRELYVRYEQP